jgi:hypothetical protein
VRISQRRSAKAVSVHDIPKPRPPKVRMLCAGLWFQYGSVSRPACLKLPRARRTKRLDDLGLSSSASHSCRTRRFGMGRPPTFERRPSQRSTSCTSARFARALGVATSLHAAGLRVPPRAADADGAAGASSRALCAHDDHDEEVKCPEPLYESHHSATTSPSASRGDDVDELEELEEPHGPALRASETRRQRHRSQARQRARSACHGNGRGQRMRWPQGLQSGCLRRCL